ncbi:hypothetical protein QBC46DRAFT_356082 [Diplogelasinospora grovesii]|uniref:Protein-ribulosamine 3-kinase n=1 Tax=Diplogelasinospora grovesii TaxID=303347 RepID=A0AAN6N2S3_9PEZI|nr:hypothetical protein QBC46DRAFT_356082 [Diplogelasinospora grovesii]
MRSTTRILDRFLQAMKTSNCIVQGIEGDFPVHTAVRDALPEDTRILRADRHSVSAIWYLVGVIHALDGMGMPVLYFVKYAVGHLGFLLTGGRTYAMRNIGRYMPEAVPRTMSHGSMSSGDHDLPAGSFFLQSLVNFESHDQLDPSTAAQGVARLHLLSVGSSDRFGSQFPMYDELFCHVQGMESDWAVLFGRMLCQAFLCNRSVNGHWEELDFVTRLTLAHVVPRLLGSLDQDRGGIKPCLIHGGGLRDGNMGKEVQTGRYFLFNSNGFWGHNEMELGIWEATLGPSRSAEYRAEYFKRVRPAEPASEVEDRIRLYMVNALAGMKYLLMKYVPGYLRDMHSLPLPAELPYRGFVEEPQCTWERSEIMRDLWNGQDE